METPQGSVSRAEICLFILVDGARADVMAHMIAAGELPNIGRYLTLGNRSLTAVTCLPSSTSLAYLPMLTGQYPGPAGVPGSRWVEKEHFAPGSLWHQGHRSYIGPGLSRFDSDLSERVETLFELCPGALAFRSEIQRGLSPEQNRHWLLLSPLLAAAHYIRWADPVDRGQVWLLCRELRLLDREIPHFIFLPLSNVDTRSHAHGPLSRQVAASYRSIDLAIGTIVETLQQLDLWSRTHLLASSDHGHTATHAHLDLSRLVEHAGYRVFEYPMILRRQCTAAVMISGNALAHVYLATGEKWDAPLSAGQLQNEHGLLLKRLKQREEIEWLAYRGDDGNLVIETETGRAILGEVDGAYTYQWEEQDPLRLRLSRTQVPKAEALIQTVETPFPDALEQIWHLFRSSRTGDLVITAKPGYDLRARYEWPQHHSSHGGLSRDQMLVPLLSNRPLNEDKPIRTADLFPTMANSLGLQPRKPHFGRSLL